MSALTVIITPPADWTVIVAPFATLVGGLGGFWLAGRNDEARDIRAAKRESEARRSALAERMEEDRHTIQRDTLLELQDELQRYARVTYRIFTQDQKTLTEQGQMFQLPPGLSDEEFESRTSLFRLQTRVLDDELREGIEKFIKLSTRLGMGKEPAGQALPRLQAQDAAVQQHYLRVLEQLGRLLRRELDRRAFTTDSSSEPDQEARPA